MWSSFQLRISRRSSKRHWKSGLIRQTENNFILGCLYDVYEKNVDIQVWFKWTPGLVHCGIIQSQFTMLVGIRRRVSPDMDLELLLLWINCSWTRIYRQGDRNRASLDQMSYEKMGGKA